jgi:hypothetical protein
MVRTLGAKRKVLKPQTPKPLIKLAFAGLTMKTVVEKAYKACVSKRLATSEAETEKAYENKPTLTDEATKEKIATLATVLKSLSKSIVEFILNARLEAKIKAEVDALVEAKVEELLWAEDISELSSYSKMRKTKNTVLDSVSCIGCRWFKALGDGRYGRCSLWRCTVKASEGCLQKECYNGSDGRSTHLSHYIGKPPWARRRAIVKKEEHIYKHLGGKKNDLNLLLGDGFNKRFPIKNRPVSQPNAIAEGFMPLATCGGETCIGKPP